MLEFLSSTGRWVDPYSGKSFDKTSALDIDHIVPLKHAYTYGARNWTKEQCRAFANDPQKPTRCLEIGPQEQTKLKKVQTSCDAR